MKINASTGRAPKNISLHDQCWHLKLDGQTEDDAKFLSSLYRALLVDYDASLYKCSLRLIARGKRLRKQADKLEKDSKEKVMNRKAFTLIELLVVILIISIITVIGLPMALSALSHRQVTESARLVQSTLVGLRDRAVLATSQSPNAVVPSGMRLIPDPAFPLVRLPSGQIDTTQPIAYNRAVIISPPDFYTNGRVTVVTGVPQTLYNIPYPGPGTSNNRNPVFGQTSVLTAIELQVSSSGVINEPTAWYWNVRVGDQIQFQQEGMSLDSDGPWYRVVGPMTITPAQGNSEMFVNVGPPLTQSPLQIGPLNPEFLFLVNERDDNKNGYVDEGWDGIDNDGVNGIDDIGEWIEVEKLQQDINFDNIYCIRRRPFQVETLSTLDLPSNMVIDLSRSKLPFNVYTGYVDIIINPNGTVVPTTIYSSPSSFTMDKSFTHLWLSERADVGLATPKGEWALVTIFGRTGKVSTLVNPDPSTAIAIAQMGER